MSAFGPAAAVRRYHAAIERLDFQVIESFFAEDARYVSAGVGALEGRAAIMAGFRQYFGEYSDQSAADDTVETLTPRSARAVWRLTATSSKTGRISRRRGEETVTFDGEGRIVLVEVTDF